MKKILFSILLSASLFLFTDSLRAQGAPPPPPDNQQNGNQPGGGAPLDGGLALLLAAGSLYGLWKFQKHNKTDTNLES